MVMYRNRIIFASIILMVLIAIPITPAIILKTPIEDTLLAEQLLLDLIQGKLTGFIKLTIKPVINGTPVQDTVWFIAIHNFTGSEHKYSGLSDRIVYDKFVKPGTYNIKVNRIPIKSTATGKTIYKPVELYIHVATENYAGGIYIDIEPDQPIKSVEITVPLHKREPASITCTSCSRSSTANLQSGCPPDAYEVSQQLQYAYVKCGECHSINGIEARWTITTETHMYFSHHSRDLTYKWWDMYAPCYALLEKTDTGWYDSGKARVESSAGDYVAQNNFGAVEVLAHVGYKCERWYDSNFVGLDGEHVDYEYYIMTPVDLDDLDVGDQVSCSECGSKPPSGYNVIAESTPDRIIEFEVGDESYWEWTSVSFTFSFSSGKTVSFGAGIAAVRKSINPPYLRVIVHNWGNQEHRYYFWFEDNSKHTYIVHMSWIPPS
ncbi:MAG: hypothetical protein LM601_04760 [Candidatus Verstraetearchaeota archaeon]|nr:hypothetical protein [Candidatus Verstraetearchaeota archaeon]